VIVRFRRSATRNRRSGLRRLAGVRAGQHVDGVPGLEIAQARPGESPSVAAARLAASPYVLYAHPNYVRNVSLTPNDALFSTLWGLHNTGQTGGAADADIDAPEAWEVFAQGQAVVAVADTGVDENHEDLDGNIWTNPGESGTGKETNGVDDDSNGLIDDVTGWDWTAGSVGCTGAASGDNTPDPPDWTGQQGDRSYHGTHVASTIGAEGGNGVGVIGVNPGSKLMNLRIGTIGGSIEVVDELCAMEYAAANGARVFNGSYGGPSNVSAVTDLIGAHPEVLFVFAAGNDGTDNDLDPQYPCAVPHTNVICVAASDASEDLAWFSNFGLTAVDLAAPGASVRGAFNTTPGNEYNYLSGTSMATPHVAGAASLLFARHPSLTAAQVRLALLAGVDQRSAYSCAAVTGGRLNLQQSLAIADTLASGGSASMPSSTCTSPPSSPPPASPPSNTTPDTMPPLVTLLGDNKGSLPRNAQFGFKVACNEQCNFSYRVRISRLSSYTGTGVSTPSSTSSVKVKPSRRVRRKLSKRLRRRTVPVTVLVNAADASGNAAPVARLTLLLWRR
jgi:hypothetical protein